MLVYCLTVVFFHVHVDTSCKYVLRKTFVLGLLEWNFYRLYTLPDAQQAVSKH